MPISQLKTILSMAKQHLTTDFLEYTKQVWVSENKIAQETFEPEVAIENAVGFFTLLMEWDQKDE